MTKGFELDTTDLKRFQRWIGSLEEKEQKKIWLSTLTKSGTIIRTAARAKIRPISKSIAKSIIVIKGRKGKSAKYPTVYIGPNLRKDDAWKAKFWEYGVSGIKKKSRRVQDKNYDQEFASKVANVKKGQRYRVDIIPRPFMRPAIDQTDGQVRSSITTNTYKAYLQWLKRKAKRQGLKMT